MCMHFCPSLIFSPKKETIDLLPDVGFWLLDSYHGNQLLNSPNRCKVRLLWQPVFMAYLVLTFSKIYLLYTMICWPVTVCIQCSSVYKRDYFYLSSVWSVGSFLCTLDSFYHYSPSCTLKHWNIVYISCGTYLCMSEANYAHEL